MQKIEGSNRRFFKPCLLQTTTHTPSEKGSLIRAVTESSSNRRDVLLHRDLRVHHVRLAEDEQASGTEDPSNLGERWGELEMMQDRHADDRVECGAQQRKTMRIGNTQPEHPALLGVRRSGDMIWNEVDAKHLGTCRREAMRECTGSTPEFENRRLGAQPGRMDDEFSATGRSQPSCNAGPSPECFRVRRTRNSLPVLGLPPNLSGPATSIHLL